MTGETIRICCGGGSGLAEDRGTFQPGGAKQAFSRLFAATAALTGAAMTARTVTRTVAAADGRRSVRGRIVGTSCPAGCGIGESRKDLRTGGRERREVRRRIDIGLVHALSTRMQKRTLSEAFSGENGESVADVYLQPVCEHGVGAE